VDLEVIYALIGILVLVFVIVFTLRTSSNKQVQTKSQKREQIVLEYEKELQSELEPLKENKQDYINKKSELLKRFSNELARNIFFDQTEIKDIILNLSKKY
jgi:hypothetical protein